MRFQGHTTLGPRLADCELLPLESPGPRGLKHQRISPISHTAAGQIQNGPCQHKSVIFQAPFSPEKRSITRAGRPGSVSGPGWRPLPLTSGCGQAEWLPWPCQIVMKPTGTRDLPMKGAQGQWKERASKFQEAHGVYSEAGLPSPIPLPAPGSRGCLHGLSLERLQIK